LPKVSIYILFILFIVGCSTLFAQNIDVSSLDRAHFKMTKDKFGYIWIGTNKGLVRYHNLPENSEKQFDKGSITNMFLDSKGVLWYCSYTGNLGAINTNSQYKINLENDYHFSDTLKQAYLQWQYAFEEKDTVFLFIRDKLCLKLYNGNARLTNTDNNKELYIAKLQTRFPSFKNYTDTIDETNYDSKNYYFSLRFYGNTISFRNKILIQDKNNSDKLIFDGDKIQLSDNISDFEIVNDSLYISFFEKNALLKIKHYQSPTPKYEYLLDNINLTGIKMDKAQNIWVSTYSKGLFILKNNNYYEQDKILESSNTNYASLNAINIFDSNLTLSFASKKIAIYSNGTLKNYALNDFDYNTFQDEVKFIKKHEDQLIIVGLKKISSFHPSTYKTKTLQNFVYNFKDINYENNELILPSFNNIYTYNIASNLLEKRFENINVTTSAVKIDDKNYLIGTYRGLYINEHKIDNASLNNAYIKQIKKVGKQIVISTEQGLYQGNISRIDNIKQISDNSINKLKLYNNKVFALSFENLFVFDLKDSLKLLLQMDLKSLNNKNYKDICGNDSLIYLLHNKGIDILNIEKLLQNRSLNNHSKLYVTCAINQFPAILQNQFNIKYTPNNTYKFNFEYLNFLSNEAHFAYQIAHDDYISPKIKVNANSFTLSDLAPNNYTLTFFVNNELPYSINLNIKPLWYQTNTFRILVQILIILIVAGIVYFILKRRHDVKHQRLTLEKEIAENNLMIGFLSLNPHFIFNILIPLQKKIISNHKDDALEYLSSVSVFLRKMIKSSFSKFDTIENNLSFIHDYLHFQKHRFNNFNYSVHLNISKKSMEELIIPALLIQPLLENSIEHGFKNLNCEGEINIFYTETEKHIEIVIEDNGIGRIENISKKPNHALSIIEQFIKILNQQYQIGSFETKNNVSKGIKSVLILPKITKNGFRH